MVCGKNTKHCSTPQHIKFGKIINILIVYSDILIKVQMFNESWIWKFEFPLSWQRFNILNSTKVLLLNKTKHDPTSDMIFQLKFTSILHISTGYNPRFWRKIYVIKLELLESRKRCGILNSRGAMNLCILIFNSLIYFYIYNILT